MQSQSDPQQQNPGASELVFDEELLATAKPTTATSKSVAAMEPSLKIIMFITFVEYKFEFENEFKTC